MFDICSICLEKNSDQRLICGHCFHGECIDKWLEEQSTCPNCRKLVHSDIQFEEGCKPEIITKDLVSKIILVIVAMTKPCKIVVKENGSISIEDQY